MPCPTLAPVFASIAMRWLSERAPGTDHRGDTTRWVSGTEASSNDGGLARIGFEVDHVSEQLDQAETVGDRMVHLHHERRPLARQPFDDAQLPQRTVLVERTPREALRMVEHVASPDSSARQSNPAVVVVDVEERILRPPRRCHAGLFVDDPLTQPRDGGGDAFDDGIHPAPIRHRVQEPHARDRRTQERVALDVPEDRVALAHPLVVLQLAHRGLHV